MMLKLLTSESKKTEKASNSKDSDEVEILQESVDNTVESTESRSNSLKRKIDDNKGAMKLARTKPNFFIAVQVNDVGIHHKVKKLQEKLIMRNPLLFPALVNVSTLHVTLAVTHLSGENDINRIKKKLDEWADENVKKYFEEPCILSFSGVRTFNNTVAYVDIEQSESYKKISELSKNVNNILSSSGFDTEKRTFTPHLTFLKLSKDFKLLKSKRKFIDDFEFLKECKEHFGKQEVNQIQLLSMDEPKDKFGYYKCFHHIRVSESNLNADHSECCAPIVKPRKLAK